MPAYGEGKGAYGPEDTALLTEMERTLEKLLPWLEAEGFTINMAGKGSFVAPQNMELLRENRLAEIERKLTDIMEYARPVGITGADLKTIIDELSRED